MNDTPDFFSDIAGTLVSNLEVISVRARPDNVCAAQDKPKFDGDTYVPHLDESRLVKQLGRVKQYMSDGEWHTLAEIALACDCSESSASARLRDLRKPRFGLYTVSRKRIGPGLFSYRLGGRGL